MIVPNDSLKPEENGDEYVLLENYPTLIAAELAKSTLEMAGIEARIFDGETASINWLYTNAIGGVKLMVRREDLSAAREILGSETGVDDSIVSEADEIGGSSPYCSQCHSKDLEVAESGNRPAFPLVHFFRKNFGSGKALRCRNCGNIWSV